MQTVIEGYTVELELYTERGEQRSDCTVSLGKFSSSLARLEHEGTLYSPNWENEEEVDPRTISKIEKWATANGY